MSNLTPDPSILDPIEIASRDEISALQLERMRWSLRHAYDNVPMYKARFDEAGVTPDDLKTLSDLANFPFTYKDDLRANYPFGMFAVPRDQIMRIHASSGTTGKATVVGYTAKDIDNWGNLVARSLRAAGLRKGDLIHNAYGYGLFTGGLGAHYGIEKLGATVVPMGGGQTDKQVGLINDFKPRGIMVTPSYMLNILEAFHKAGLDPRESSLEIAVFGAEPWTEAMRKRIESSADIRAFDIYGLSEIVGPGVAAECEEQNGLHVFEDHFFPEIIDPESGTVLPDGEEGELVLTTLSKEAMPLIRYRTGDITKLLPEPCGCGRTLRKIQRIHRRSDDMLIVRGVNVYPAQIEAALLSVEGTLPHYQIELTRKDDLDQVAVHVEVEAGLSDDHSNQTHTAVMQAMKSGVGIRVEVQLLKPQTLPRSEGKANRVFDRRSE